MEDIKLYGTLVSGTIDETVAKAEEIMNTETGNKVNVDLRRTREKVDTSLQWH